MANNLDNIGALVEIVPAQHLRTYPDWRVLWAFAVEVKHLGVVPETKRWLVTFPKRIDGSCHTAGIDVSDIG